MTARRAVAHLDVRVATAAERQRITRAPDTLHPVDARTRLEVTCAWNRPVFERTEAVGQGAHARSECTSVSGMVFRSAPAAGVLTALAGRE
ncbi:hypothetical protein [Streptomyces nigra]|uniref:hypothetical protein n=1 Tax=Streptomyces nigra TaxID=1827580 RepID=UPI0034371A8E